ncbi:DMT family transporter [Rhizobium pusense]|uniref:DMT family transporter n=4 Tax=Hyphomicrobiales TaxID=356 RepID=A0A256GZS4_9HYPH|nr:MULTISPECIES: DMT family transporter [Hyphomicrobiales]QCM13546.1 DMT family transporter [Agrobacterium tumefaciens]KAB2701524.1 DMT family transporter [Brucella lupini]MDH0912437.1 DMT family transporter [Agrobacterium pusense]MDH1098543.1 DMT family transporter [Agrobacterium pusense]MDH1115253.1 DMT family transporter [Agrobacterium pusense]
MLLGIIAGLTTCALWGLTFIAPRAIGPFTAWDLTIARYGIFGLACLLLMADRRFRPTGIAPSRLLIGLLLGGAGYVGYFISAAFAVQLAGAAVPPVIIGTMPVFLAIIANIRDRCAPWKALAPPLALIAIGVASVNVATIGAADVADTGSILLGALASSAALAIWIAYGLVNAGVMRSTDAPDGLQWTGLQGIGAAVGSLLLLPLVSFDLGNTASTAETFRFIAWALVMGLAGSWFATWCWVIASRRLPLALAAQLIVAETVFGLAYGFAFEGRFPTLAEAIGVAMQFLGVCSAIAVFSKPRTSLGLSQNSVVRG